MDRKKKGIGIVAGIAAVLVVILVFDNISDVYTESNLVNSQESF